VNTPGGHSNGLGWLAHVPWLAGLVLAPLLFGCVNPEGQAVVGFLLATSLLLTATRLGSAGPRLLPRAVVWLAVAFLVVPLIPLPLALVEWLSPARAGLAREFPVEAGAAPSMLGLTVSTAGTVQRIWELCLAVAALVLAREAAKDPRGGVRLALGVGLAVLLLEASDLWYRQSGRRSILGFWQIAWGVGAGTFANPNHFANWLYTAVLFLLGGVLRGIWPLHSARQQPIVPAAGGVVRAVVLLAICAGGLVLAVASGSRGGFVAFAAGVFTWGALLARRSQRRERWALIAFGGLALFLALLSVSDLLVRKLAQVDVPFLARYSKFQIWRQTWDLFVRFPVFGTGWGGFSTAFNHFKTAFGGMMCWHVENDYLQLLVETGVVGMVVYGVLIVRLLRAGVRHALYDRLLEPEYVFGAVAALVCFGVNALFEFVGQIPANLLLAASLLGFLLGSRAAAAAPTAPRPPSGWRVAWNHLAALGLGAVALLQAFAFWNWYEAGRHRDTPTAVERVARSLELWPWASNRQLGLTRQQVNLARDLSGPEREAAGREMRARLNQTLGHDPYHWELRLERAWLDLAFSTNARLALEEAREVARLNPRQPQIPLRFARFYANRAPEVAYKFLEMADRTNVTVLEDALTLSWQLGHDTARLWALTPPTTPGLLRLGDFAVKTGLHPLAAQAYLLVTNGSPVLLAERMLAARRPDLALTFLERAGPATAPPLLLCRAQLEAGHYDEAVRLVTALVEGTARGKELLLMQPPGFDLGMLRAEWERRPDDLERARRLAAKLAAQNPPAADLALLGRLAARFPRDPQLLWALFQAEQAAGLKEQAAASGYRLLLALAERR